MDDGSAAVLARSVEETAEGLGPDGPAYRRLFGPLVRRSEPIIADVLSPLRLPSHPFAMARFGIPALRSAAGLARRFQRPHARALLGGIGAHAVRPLDRLPTGAVALVLGLLGHSVGWPVAKGGSRRITDALAEHLRSLGGEITTGHRVGSLAELRADVIILDVTPRQLARIGAERLPAAYRRSLLRYRYGPGVFKVDWALDGPIPWKATECSRAGTVHLGGTFEEIAASEEAVSRGEHPERPYVLVGQQSLFDPGRAPAGKHTGWAYCHVPNGSDVDVTARIEAQMERFAPGFRDLIRARSVMGPADLERHNENCVGGDIAAGSQTLWQTFARPTPSPVPYATPLPHVYLGSASTPPGPGVHGMCGALAARAALRRSRG
jgi:phytoene dehydrogenase-like protein